MATGFSRDAFSSFLDESPVCSHRPRPPPFSEYSPFVQYGLLRQHRRLDAAAKGCNQMSIPDKLGMRTGWHLFSFLFYLFYVYFQIWNIEMFYRCAIKICAGVFSSGPCFASSTADKNLFLLPALLKCADFMLCLFLCICQLTLPVVTWDKTSKLTTFRQNNDSIFKKFAFSSTSWASWIQRLTKKCVEASQNLFSLICHEYFLQTFAVIEVSVSLTGVRHDQDS